MEQKTYSFTCTTVHKKVFVAAIVMYLLAATVFCVFYLLSNYQSLSEWYINLGPCFYKQQQWGTYFFTQTVKNKGNIFAGAGTLMSLAGGAYLVINRKKYTTNNSTFTFTFSRSTVYWYLAIVATSIALGIMEWLAMAPAYDEVFSAVNCAGMPVFRTLSYYMLPNNHIGYNVFNNILFSWYGDFVASGRLMSLLSYVGVMVTVFYFLSKVIKNHLFAFIALIPVALQFQTWGFAAQARSYEPILFCGWIAMVSVLWHTKNNKSRYLAINTAANAVGFILLHSYIYLYLAQLVYQLIYFLYIRKWDTGYIKHQLALAVVVYTWYMPALCFSGLEAFTNNKWVLSSVDNVWDFIPQFSSSFVRFISDCFGAYSGFGVTISYIVFVSPLMLLFTKNRMNRLIAVLYLSVWGSYILYSMVLLLTPFHRTLIIHFSFTVACCVYTFYVLLNYIADNISSGQLKAAVKMPLFIVPVLLYSGYQFSWNRSNAYIAVYGYDVNATYNTQSAGLKQIPAGSSIAFSDEAFYYYYIAEKMHYTTNRCNAEDAAYYIKSEAEALPEIQSCTYHFVAGCGDDYAIYKRD